MRRLTITALARTTLLAALGLLPANSHLAQSGQSFRIPEPTGVPVQRHRNPQLDGRPFSADYQSAWRQRLQAQREWMTLEQMRRSEPPSTRFARQTQIEYRNQQIQNRMETIRRDARPDYVVHARNPERKPALLSRWMKKEESATSPERPAWSVAKDLQNPFKKTEPEGVVTSVRVIAEYPVEAHPVPTRPSGLLARLFSKDEPTVVSNAGMTADGPSTNADQGIIVWTDDAQITEDVVVDDAGLVLSPIPEEATLSEEEAYLKSTPRPIPTAATQASPATIRVEPNPVAQTLPPRVSMTLPMPELPVEEAVVESVDVLPATSTSATEPRIQKIKWTVTEADFLQAAGSSSPVLPDMSVIPEKRLPPPEPVFAPPGEGRHLRKADKKYELPEIPDEVLRKYKAQ